MRTAWTIGRDGQGKGRQADQRGFVMLVALILLSGLVFIAGSAAIRSTRQTQVSSAELDNARTFYAAEGAVEFGSDQLRTLLNNVLDPTQGQLDAITAPTIPGFTITNYHVTKVGALTSERITSGDYTGLDGYVQRYNVEADASSERRNTHIVREIQHQYIPLFQFGVFYEKDLEIFPGADMTFSGPIHTNGDLYMGCDGATLRCQSTVTAVGRYWHYRKDNSHIDLSGPVYIKDTFGTWQNVWRGSYWLDNRRVTWASDALSLWGGNFRDASHGLSTLRLPLPATSDQHEVIERGVAGDNAMQKASKYWYKATVRYVDGALKDSAGHVLTQPGVYTYTQNKFYDARQNKNMDVVDIDVAAMIAGHYVPPNNILYISNSSGDAPCVRLKNAATLPLGGLTVATDLPLYIMGNYNSVSKKGSSLLCDAITILSPAWTDGNSAQPIGNRIATPVTVNACVMAGHVNTPNGGTYSGGLENIFRFLESWSGVTVTFRGSIIDLWFSRLATAPWGQGNVYNPPNRNWGYDTDLLSPTNWPPGAPKVHTVQRGTWRQIS
ncbi:MAG TPA: hypothetical protein VGL38_12575 [bacterium]|jgi:hypothetical protein